jgi:muramoyltetrapeptide carboxypeptidase
VRILDRIDFRGLTTNPKWIIGYSDVTAIHNKLHNVGVQSLHAVMPVSFKDTLVDNKEAIKSFKNVLFGIKNEYKIKSSAYNRLGVSQGVLVGGNLTLLHTMLGSDTSINVDGKILFIEDIGEYTYHIDRMLYSLKRAGYFDKCKGVVVGAFSSIKENNPPFTKNVEELILAVLSEYQFPIVFNFPVGHIDDNRALIIGEKVDLIVNKDVTTLKFY